MNWGIEDLTAAAALLSGGIVASTVILRTVRRPLLRFFGIGAVALAVAAIWAHLAVGVF